MTTAIIALPNQPLAPLKNAVGSLPSRLYEIPVTKASTVLERLRHDLIGGAVTSIITHTLDFPGVGTRRLIKELSTWSELGVRLQVLELPWLDLTVHGPLLEYLYRRMEGERRDSVKAGSNERRKPGRPRAVIPEEAFVLADNGLSLRAIASRTGLGASTIGRALAHRRALQGVAA